MPDVLSLSELTAPAFLGQLQGLRLVARGVPPGGRFADQRSNERGAGLEFLDHRGYSPGDDLRKVDWHLYRRLGKLFVRQFEELEDLPVYLLPDCSRSAHLGDPPRARAAGFVCAGLASVALAQHDRVGVLGFSDELSIDLPPTSGADRLVSVLQALCALEPRGGTDVAAALQRLDALGLRRGLAVVVSDFFDPRGIEAVTAALTRVRHRLLLVQLVAPDDRRPRLEGELRVQDCETGETADVAIEAALLDRYEAAYERFQSGLSDFARRRGVGLVRLDVTAPVVPQLARLFEAGRLSV